jgi:hypothetical protein
MLKHLLLINAIKEEWNNVIDNKFKDVFDTVIGGNENFTAENLSNIFEATIWKFFIKLASNLMDESIGIINKFIVEATNIKSIKDYIIDYSELLSFIQIISGTLLIFLIVNEAVERQASDLITTKDRNLVYLIGRTVLASVFIYLLPQTFAEILLKINSLLVGGISEKADFADGSFSIDIFLDVGDFSVAVTIAFVLMSVAFFALAIIGIIRYLEIIITILLAPVSAAFFIKSNDKLSIWIREITSVIFAQSIYALLLAILVKVFENNALENFESTELFVKYIITTGIIAVMLKGPNLIRRFLYNYGNSTVTLNNIGYMGKISAYKYILSRELR